MAGGWVQGGLPCREQTGLNGNAAGLRGKEATWGYTNRCNLALVNTGEVDSSESVFDLDIYDRHGNRVGPLHLIARVEARRWRQINSILANHAPGITHAYVRIKQDIGNNPFLTYGVVNDGGAPGERSGDGAYLPARK